MTVPSDSAPVLDTTFFRRWLDRATELITEQATYLTDLDSAIGDADHGSNLRRGFTSASAVVAAEPPATPAELLKAFGTHLTSTVGGASGPLYGTVLRRVGRGLGDAETVLPEALGEGLAAAVAGVRRLGDSGPGDKTMVDALGPASEAYAAALESGSDVTGALTAAARAAHEGAEATIPMLARRGRASYLGERSIGHQDPGATSSALLMTALLDAARPVDTSPGPVEAAAVEGRPAEEAAAVAAEAAAAAEAADAAAPPGGGEAADAGAGAAPGAGEAAGAGAKEAAAPGAAGEAPAVATPAEEVGGAQPEGAQAPAGRGAERGGHVGVVLVAHSRELASATADLAKALVGSGEPAPVAAAGGLDDGSIGTSAGVVRRAVKHVDGGRGVVVLCDMGSAVLTAKALLAETGTAALPENVRIADAPFVEGAVGALVTASTGADLDMVIAAAEDARTYRKL